jgi:hypothetical protein
MPFAMAIRHLFAHGQWTPTGSNVLTKRAVDALDSLQQGLRLAGQNLFDGYWKEKANII